MSENDAGEGRDAVADGAESTDPDAVDPDALREDLDAIKSAMGIEERYPGQGRMWLVHGGLIGGAAVATNVAFVFDLPPVAYVVGWFALVAVVVLAQLRLVSRTASASAPTLDWRQLFGALALAIFALWSSLGDLVGAQTEGAEQGAHYFSHVLVFLGLAFLIVGVVLAAERIAFRDRLPFYAGGAWMLALAAVLPHVRFLQLTGWGVFGVLFAVHSVVAYLLTRDS